METPTTPVVEMLPLAKPVKTVVLEVVQSTATQEANRMRTSPSTSTSITPQVTKTTAQATKTAWPGVATLLTSMSNTAGSMRCMDILDQLENHVVSEGDTKEAEGSLALFKKTIDMSADEFTVWLSKSPCKNIMMVHQTLALLYHFCGIRRAFILDMLDACHKEFYDIDCKPMGTESQQLEYYYKDPGLLTFLASNSVEIICSIENVAKNVPYVVRSLRDGYFVQPEG